MRVCLRPFAVQPVCPARPRVQAVLALREIVLSRWGVLGAQAQQATLQFLLGLALGPLAADPRPLLRTQVGALGFRAHWLGLS